MQTPISPRLFEVQCRIEPNGDLAVLANNTARAWIKEQQARGRLSDDILWDAFEGYWANGMYEPFDAGRANPFVGLTSAPCIAESMNVEDDGERTIEGRLWYFNEYCLEDPMETLKCKGRVVFTLAP